MLKGFFDLRMELEEFWHKHYIENNTSLAKVVNIADAFSLVYMQQQS